MREVYPSEKSFLMLRNLTFWNNLGLTSALVARHELGDTAAPE